MQATLAGLSEADWLATPSSVRDLVTGQQEQILLLQHQQTTLATELASLRERIGRSSRNSSKPASSDASGFKPTGKGKSKGSGRKRGSQEGHSGAGPDLLPSEQCQEVIPHHPSNCRGCGAALSGDDPEPLRHQVVEIPAIVPFVIEHQLHRLSCNGCRSVTAAALPVGVERGGYGPRLSSLVGLLDQVLSITISTGAINSIRCRLSESLAALRRRASIVRCHRVLGNLWAIGD
jgi:transposase